MTAAIRTVEDPNGDISVNVDTANLGAGVADVPYVKLVSGAASATGLIEGTAANGLEVDVTRVSGNVVVLGGDIPGELASTNGAVLLVGGRSESTTPAAVSDGDAQYAWMSLEGAQVMTFARTKTAALVPTIDTAVYADLDRLGSVVTVSNAGLGNGRSGQIVNAMLVDDAASNFSIEAWFFAVTPTLANADNGIFSLTDANMATAVPLGVIDFWSANSKTFTDGRICPGTYLGGPVSLHYTCAAADSAIYMVLRARGAYDAAATDDLNIYLDLIRY
jgi:hypothetical protein